jgi:CRP-like cAMP-binding protein
MQTVYDMISYKLNERAILLGFDSLEDYFQKKCNLTFTDMAEELGVTYQSVSLAYEKFFLSALQKEKSAKIKIKQIKE